MTGERERDGAHCLLSIPRSVPEYMTQHLRELTRLFVPEKLRGQGLATALMRDVVSEADANGYSLMLHVDPWDTSARGRLRAFYSRFGFKVFQEEPAVLMCRLARSAGPQSILQQSIARALH